MNLRVLKTIAVVLGVIIVLLLALLVVLMLRARRSPPEAPAPTAAPVTASPAPTPEPTAEPTAAPDGRFRADDLIGTWQEIGDESSKLVFSKTKLRWTNVFGDSGSAAYSVEKEFSGVAEGAMRIECPDYSGPFEYIIWHREEIDGKRVGVLSGVIMEYDGRGPVTFNEFLRTEDGVTVPDDWRSAVSHTLNDWDPGPTWVDPDKGEAAE